MIKLKNKFILAPVKLGYGDGTGVVNDRHLQFYHRRNKYIGAITPEPFYMDAGLRELPTPEYPEIISGHHQLGL